MKNLKAHQRGMYSSRGGSSLSEFLHSSSSTLAHGDWFLIASAPPIRNKQWLSQLGDKCKKSMIFVKGKKKEPKDKKADERLCTSPYDTMREPLIVNINQESAECTDSLLEQKMMHSSQQGRVLERETTVPSQRGRVSEQKKVLPKQQGRVLKKSPTSNVLSKSRPAVQPGPRSGSTSYSRRRVKRDSIDDPLFLKELLDEFPEPPPLPGKIVLSRDDYTPREPVKPGVRKHGSSASFSMPTSEAYIGVSQRMGVQSKKSPERPVPRGTAISNGTPSSMRKPLGRGRGLSSFPKRHYPQF
ncbi:hypothetical protein EW145_g1767 [Phellinidium pouzarii]|uniref:Uncharacterized protein n=1 Tax=Phellinidium pouzarii TaxID=167371 RepID=A0A4S4LDK7_9AGAM|nr:hypothetical protein EW145_g1767 [Phellinidium pouzarii]